MVTLHAGSAWAVLGLSHDASTADVRARYAALIKQFRPDTHPEDFARIRESYEQALRHARERESRLAEIETEEEQHDDMATQPVAAPPIAAPPVVASPIAPPVVVAEREVDAPPQRPPLPALVPPLQAHVQADGEAAALPALRRMLDDSKRVSLDERQALELALLHWFLHAESPPLLLMFDAGRAFGWHGNELHLAGWIGPGGAQLLALLLTLARDEVFARHRAGNRWLRRLFEPRGAAPWVGLRTPMEEASAWAMRWQHFAQQTGRPALLLRLNARVMRRLSGQVVWSIDFWVALLSWLPFATPVADAWLPASLAWCAMLPALVLAPLLAALRIGLVRARSHLHELAPDARLRRVTDWVRTHQRLTLYGGIASFIVLLLVALALDLPWLVTACMRIAGVTGLLAISAFVLLVLWWFTLVAERIAFVPLQWREAVDRWEMAQLLRAAPEASADAAAFGRRLSGWQRLGKWSAARALQKEELQRHERPPRANPPQIVRPHGGAKTPVGAPPSRRFNWWWVLGALFAVRGISALFG